MIVGQSREHGMDFAQPYARTLRNPDEGDAPQDTAWKATLVSRTAPAVYQPLRLIEMNSGDWHARSVRHLADAQLAWGMIFGRLHI
jgi:hypothetical protein